jgi:hypothetical protein
MLMMSSIAAACSYTPDSGIAGKCQTPLHTRCRQSLHHTACAAVHTGSEDGPELVKLAWSNLLLYSFVPAGGARGQV